MKITVEINNSQLEQFATLIADKIKGGTVEVEDDLAGAVDEPAAEEVKRAVLADVQDAIRRAGAINKDKTRAVLVKHVANGKEPRGTNLDESKFQTVIDELAKIK